MPTAVVVVVWVDEEEEAREFWSAAGAEVTLPIQRRRLELSLSLLVSEALLGLHSEELPALDSAEMVDAVEVGIEGDSVAREAAVIVVAEIQGQRPGSFADTGLAAAAVVVATVVDAARTVEVWQLLAQPVMVPGAVDAVDGAPRQAADTASPT